MVLTTLAGAATYGVAMYTVVPTGVNGETVPETGSVVYFYCKEVKVIDKNTDKRTVISGHNVLKYLTNKWDSTVMLMDCLVVAQGASTATEQLGIIRNFIYTYGSKTSAAKVYLMVYHLADAKYVWLSFTSAHVQMAYMKGYPLPCEWVSAKGKYYTAPQLIFEEVT